MFVEFYEEVEVSEGVPTILFDVFTDKVDGVVVKGVAVISCPLVDEVKEVVGGIGGLFLGEEGVGGSVVEVVHAPLNVLLFVDSNWSEALVGVGDDDGSV